jgi:hypothetical protein
MGHRKKSRLKSHRRSQQMSTNVNTIRIDEKSRRRTLRGQSAVWQARLIMLVMINIAQLWILAATVDAALARHYSSLLPLVIASAICFLITLSIIRWWRPTSKRFTSTGYVRDNRR